MQHSESVKNIAAALVLFHIKVGKVHKDSRNPFFNSTYASLTNILDTIAEPLEEAGLSIIQLPEGEFGLSTMIIHADSGEWIKDTYQMRPTKDDPQGRGSAITYQRRYAISALLQLSIDEDDDGNKASAPAPKAEQDNRKWLNKGTKEFENAVKKLKDKSITLKEIEVYYKLSKEIKTELQNIK